MGSAAIVGQRVLNKNYKEVAIRISFNPLTEKFEVLNKALEKSSEWINNINPIINDEKRGDRSLNRAFHEKYRVKRMLLHSCSLTFPFGGETFVCETDWSGRTRGLLFHLGLGLETDSYTEREPSSPVDNK